ncbi:MAG: cytochrome c [Candidatus Margulisiibacteriota bacterium]
MKKLKKTNYIFIGIILIGLIGCRGWKSEKPPIHPNINFDFQSKIKAQREPLPIPENTVQYLNSSDDKSLSTFKVDERFLKEGQKNYNIYCAACHTKTGNGTKSIITKNGWVVSNILEDTTYNRSDKQIYDIIKYGIRSMPGYGNKLNSKDIWQVVLYVRALQNIDRSDETDIKRLNRGNKND